MGLQTGPPEWCGDSRRRPWYPRRIRGFRRLKTMSLSSAKGLHPGIWTRTIFWRLRRLKAAGALREGESRRILLSSAWAPFYYRTGTPASFAIPFVKTYSLEWLLRKMGESIHMQNATWLVSRELVTAAGHWDTQLRRTTKTRDFFCRVLLASEGTRFVAGTGIY